MVRDAMRGAMAGSTSRAQPQPETAAPVHAVIEPTVAVAAGALNWTPASTKHKKRTPWPKELKLTRHGLDFASFEAYLRRPSFLKRRSWAAYIGGLKMLLSCFEVSGVDASLMGFLAAAYKTRALEQVMDLPLLRSTKSFAAKIHDTLVHLLNHLRRAANANEYDHHVKIIARTHSNVAMGLLGLSHERAYGLHGNTVVSLKNGAW